MYCRVTFATIYKNKLLVFPLTRELDASTISKMAYLMVMLSNQKGTLITGQITVTLAFAYVQTKVITNKHKKDINNHKTLLKL